MNLIFNSRGVGWANKGGIVRGLEQVRDRLQDNPQAWNSLREEAFMRMARDAQSQDARGMVQFSGQKFLTAWNNFQSESPEIARIMFTQQERNLIGQFARVAKRVTTTVPGGRAFSGTPQGIANIVKTFWNSPYVTSLIRNIPLLGGANDVANEMRVTAAVRGGIPTAAPQPQRVPVPPQVVGTVAPVATQYINE